MKKRPLESASALALAAPLDAIDLLRRAAPAMLVIGTWLAAHPYWGIIHDSRLYLVQALRGLHPEVFDQDLFFAFGSQDDFSLFGRLFAPLVGQLGPSAAAMIIVLLAHSVWLSGAAALACRIAPDKASAVAGLLLLAGMPAAYGGWGVFSYGEGFATPRPLAEGAALWALWALAGQRLAAAAALAFVSALLHPIVSLSVLCVGLGFLALQDRRWLLLGLAGAAIVAGLAGFQVGPLAGLWQTLDPEWLDVVEKRSPFIFPAQWQMEDWSRIAMASAATLAASAVLSGWRRRLMLSVVLVSLVSVAAASVGADYLENVFVTQVQIWRTVWVLHAIAYLGAGILFVRLWELKPDGLALAALLILAWLNAQMLHPRIGAFVALFVFGLVVLRLRAIIRPLPERLGFAIVVLTALLIIFLVVCRIIVLVDLIGYAPVGGFLAAFGTVGVIELSLGAAIAFLLARFLPRLSPRVFPPVALILLLASAVVWDRRNEWSYALATGEPISAFDSLLAPDAEVYWEDDLRGAWLQLRRPSYVSAAQGAGTVFNRETAITFRDRAQVIDPLMARPLVQFRTRNEPSPPLPELSRDMLADACRTDRALDAMVLSRAVEGAYAATWDPPMPLYEPVAARKGIPRRPVTRYYLYRCADLR